VVWLTLVRWSLSHIIMYKLCIKIDEENSPAFDFFVIISGEVTLTTESGAKNAVL
jgi:hypothetical protein